MQKEKIIVALDAMGGDYGPSAVIEGADLALHNFKQKYPNLSAEFLIFGNKDQVSVLVNKSSNLKSSSVIIHSEDVVSSDEKPSIALRNSKNTSMGMAINAVKQKDAHAVVSSGNTGALMAISKVALRTLPGISRPAIIGLFPAVDRKIVMLDLGANAECEINNLVEFAIMGDAFAKVMLNKNTPAIALLNIGSEDIKGNEIVKGAASILSEQKIINFSGYIEADDISRGRIDVVVADGFTGNVAIKMAEGTGLLCRKLLEKAFKSSWISKLGYIFAKKALKHTFQAIDGRYYNGAMLIGLNGVVVKSHGGADKVAFSNAVEVALELSLRDINNKIIQEIETLQKQIKLN